MHTQSTRLNTIAVRLPRETLFFIKKIFNTYDAIITSKKPSCFPPYYSYRSREKSGWSTICKLHKKNKIHGLSAQRYYILNGFRNFPQEKNTP